MIPRPWTATRHRIPQAKRLLAALCVGLACPSLAAPGESSQAEDPFGDLETKPKAPEVKPEALQEKSGLHRFFHEDFIFKREIFSQFTYNEDASGSKVFSRQSVGFEAQKKFSTRTATVASFDLQVRLVRRDNPSEVINDVEGMHREGWDLEVHNAYLDFYNVLNPVLGDRGKGEHVGRFNFRAGHFYLPFGRNLQTDTHGTVLQLSNERNFGFERDWYAGLWGSANEHLNYDAYYMLGSGTDVATRGQRGLLGTRLSLGNRYRNDYGIEGGLAFMGGERISNDAVERSPSVQARADHNNVVDTRRFGPDFRYTRVVPTGTLAYATELSAGEDESDRVLTQLHQLDYLNYSRKWGFSTQYRRFWQDIDSALTPAGQATPGPADASLFFEFTWYFRNDVGNANLHWIKLTVEEQLERQRGGRDLPITLQYYWYF